MDEIKNFANKNKVIIIYVLLAVVLGVYLNWKDIEILIFAVFVGIIIRPVSSRLMAIPALFFLAWTPLLLLLGREERAEEFAIYAYYFLIMAVIMGIYEIRKEDKEQYEKADIVSDSGIDK